MKSLLTTFALLFSAFLLNAQTKVLSSTGKISPVLVPSDTTRFLRITGDQTATGTKTFDKLYVNTEFKIGPVRMGLINGTTTNLGLGSTNTLSSVTTGTYNLAVGMFALSNLVTANQNNAFGHFALSNSTTGSFNTALGTYSMSGNTTGSQNVALGVQSLNNNQAGTQNTAIGTNALRFNKNGTGNIGIGYNQETDTLSGTNTTYTTSNAMNIGGLLFGKNMTGSAASPAGFLGIAKLKPAYTLDVNGTINGTALYVNTNLISSDARLKTNIKPISNAIQQLSLLKPVEYRKKVAIKDKTYPNYEYGFIAQEVKKVLPFLVSEGKDEDKILSLNYTALIPLLTNAIQDQQKNISQMLKTIDTQLKEIDRLKSLEKRIQLLEQKR